MSDPAPTGSCEQAKRSKNWRERLPIHLLWHAIVHTSKLSGPVGLVIAAGVGALLWPSCCHAGLIESVQNLNCCHALGLSSAKADVEGLQVGVFAVALACGIAGSALTAAILHAAGRTPGEAFGDAK